MGSDVSGSAGKSPNKDMEKKKFQLFDISFCTWKPNALGFGNCSVPNFAKPVLDIFAVCSLVLRINLSQRQQGYLFPKNQNYLLGKADLGFFLSYGLRTTIKITIFSTFYVIDNFSSYYSWNSCKKIQTPSIKLFLSKNQTS